MVARSQSRGKKSSSLVSIDYVEWMRFVWICWFIIIFYFLLKYMLALVRSIRHTFHWETQVAEQLRSWSKHTVVLIGSMLDKLGLLGYCIRFGVELSDWWYFLVLSHHDFLLCWINGFSGWIVLVLLGQAHTIICCNPRACENNRDLEL